MTNYTEKKNKIQDKMFSDTKLYIQYSFVDKNGEVLYSKEEVLKPKTKKKGWCTMYPKDYAEAMISLAGKKNATKLWWFLVGNGYLKKDGTIKPFNRNKVANILGIKRTNLQRALKELKDVEIIAEIDGELRYNPFIQNVSGQKSEEIAKLQNEWEYYIGHYDYYEK